MSRRREAPIASYGPEKSGFPVSLWGCPDIAPGARPDHLSGDLDSQTRGVLTTMSDDAGKAAFRAPGRGLVPERPVTFSTTPTRHRLPAPPALTPSGSAPPSVAANTDCWRLP
jgi:hypothetical protein